LIQSAPLVEGSPIIVLTDPADVQLRVIHELRAKIDIVVGSSLEAFGGVAADATVVLNWSGSRSLFSEVFSSCLNIRWVHTRSAGVDGILSPELIESAVILTNGTGVFSASLGEFALAAILYFAKGLRRMIDNQIAGVWDPFETMPIVGQTLGIVGYGDIGRAVASRARSMGMRVLAIKRHVNPYNADPMVEHMYSPDRRIEMLSRCDYVVAAAPLTSETRGMIGEPEFNAMKPNAVVINVGRGPVINEEALIKALSTGRIKGAALDVFDHEPLADGHPFYALENVLLSPHCADRTPDCFDQAMRFFLSQFDRFIKGEPLLNVVDKKLGY